MVRGLAAQLSPREINQLIQLLQDKSELDPADFKRFVMLGLVEERPNGFAVTELGRQRLDAEQTGPASRQTGSGRAPLFRR